MSKIRSLVITSDPPRITVIWEGKGRLSRAHVDHEHSVVSVGGEDLTLAGWNCIAGPRSVGQGGHSFTLGRATSEGGYVPAPHDVVALRLHLKGNDDSGYALGAAVVDGIPPGDELVARAVRDSGAMLGTGLAAAGATAQHISDTLDGVQGLASDVDSHVVNIDTTTTNIDSGVTMLGNTATNIESHAGNIETGVGQVQDEVGEVGEKVERGMEWLTAFPFEVIEGTGATASPSAAPLSQQNTVDQLIRGVLGRSVPTGGQPIDSAGLAATLSALDRSFVEEVVDGADLWVYKPTSYTQQSPIGAGVTGQQASLAQLAQNASNEILPLLPLTPLVPEFQVNPDEIAAATAIFQQSWAAFVAELGSEGGARLPRAEGLLHDAERELGRLLGLLGMFAPVVPAGTAPVSLPTPVTLGQAVPTRKFVVTIDDETNLTNGIIINDRVTMVAAQFQLYVRSLRRQDQQPPTNDDRGMEIVLLQRDLDALSEVTQSVYDALDSVGVGADRREIIRIPGDQGLFLEDALSWSQGMSSETQALLQDGGALGAIAVERRLGQLHRAVREVIQFTRREEAEFGLKHPRVRVQVHRLETVLTAARERARRLADQVTPVGGNGRRAAESGGSTPPENGGGGGGQSVPAHGAPTDGASTPSANVN
jgi:hypothetical protein